MCSTRRALYLARHGETPWNSAGRWQGHTDIALSDVGRAQSRALAEHLGGRGIARIATSDLSRARETAEIVAAALGLARVDVDAGLRERGFGCFEGLTRQECEARFPEDWARYRADPRLRPPGGEPQEAVIARMREAALRAAAALRPVPADAAALLVSHGGAMRALVGSITGETPPPLENGALFRLWIDGEAFGDVARIAAR